MCAFLRSNKIFVRRGIIVSTGEAGGINPLTLLHIAQIAYSCSRCQTQQGSSFIKPSTAIRIPSQGISALSRLPAATFDTLFNRQHPQIFHLDKDWEDYRLEALHAHIVPRYENELAAKEQGKLWAKAKRNAAHVEMAEM